MFEEIKKELLKKYGGQKAELIKLRGGSGGKILFLAFFAGENSPSLVLKMSSSGDGNSLIESEFNKLESARNLLPESLKKSIPEPRGFFNAGGYLIGAEEAINAMQAGFNLSKKDLKKVFDWLCGFHKANILEEREINKNFLIELFRERGDNAAEAIRFIEKNWNFGNVKIPLIKQHGDFHFANIFFGVDGFKVIDWGDYGNVILPAYDLIFFLRRQKSRLTPDNELLIEYFKRFSIPQEIIPFWADLSVIIENLEKWSKK